MTWQSDFAKKSTAMKRDLLIDVWVKENKKTGDGRNAQPSPV
jgi:hypothetical protein